MFAIRRSAERGYFDHGWLKTYHSFSFGDYFDPQNMGFRALRVINDDQIAPSQGFGTHGHRDMEIITYVLSGAIAHKDSMGNGSTIYPGDVQFMSAGSGVTHSEFNAEADQWSHLLQIWVLPKNKGGTPGYQQVSVPESQKINQWCLVAGPDGGKNAVQIGQDVKIWATILPPKSKLNLPTLSDGRAFWLHVARGEVEINQQTLSAGDAIVTDESNLVLQTASQNAECLIFDLGELV